MDGIGDMSTSALQTNGAAHRSHGHNPIQRRDPWWKRRLIIAGVAAVLIAGYAWWECGLEYRFIAKRFGVVVPGKVFRSGQISQWMIEKTLVQYEIREIIDFSGLDPKDEHQSAEIAAAKRLNITIHRLPMRGNGTGDVRNYSRALEIIERAKQNGRPILVHCQAGSNRTGAAIAFYRLLIEKRSPQEVVQEMRRYKYRPKDSQVLLKYINRNLPVVAKTLVAHKVLKTMPTEFPRLKI